MYGGGIGALLFNINCLETSSIESIEYFAGPAQTPAQYMRLNAHCGVLLIRTRRSPSS